ncbi:lytic transglycosylase [Thioclava sp. SK-1]|uniref:lytic murein transglycosylase n=1 Tax=Thioclava sp. SK-1 TaxID=1889770 RepID=UPI0008262E78|nr:lytic transglycosylase [Thioclava sp. SK-1]
MRSVLLSFGLSYLVGIGSAQAHCGGRFADFIAGLDQELQQQGLSASQSRAFLAGARSDPKVLKADRSQGVFRMEFDSFAQRVISQNRLQNGAKYAARFKPVFDRVEAQYGVPRGILLAFWALETDFGQVQGGFNTRDALITLAHDCRRPDLFRPQVLAAAELYRRGDFDPQRTTGAWAGEIGQVQMLPEDILRNGVDGDGDGHVDLKGSSADALMSAGKMLAGLGWRPNEPWLQEVVVPDTLDWTKTGLDIRLSGAQWAQMGVRARSGTLASLPGSILLPMGRKGPAFIAYPNFTTLFEWNQSFVYVTSAGYFATRLEGAPRYRLGTPDAGLNTSQMKSLQQKLAAKGYDVGDVDGILGARTRAAVQAEQARLGLPADAWPTTAFLGRL